MSKVPGYLKKYIKYGFAKFYTPTHTQMTKKIIVLEKRNNELSQEIADELKHQLIKLKKLAVEGKYVHDSICNSEGVYVDYISYYDDRVEYFTQLYNREEILKQHDSCTEENKIIIDENLNKIKKKINTTKRKKFVYATNFKNIVSTISNLEKDNG